MEIRVSKYDPKLYVDGVYTGDEWTEICDIGTDSLPNKELYLEFEERYWRFTSGVLLSNEINLLKIDYLEKWYDITESGDEGILRKQSQKKFIELGLSEGSIVSIDEYEHVFKAMLRGVIFCKAIGRDGFYIHASNEFYLFIGGFFNFEWKSVEGLYVTEGAHSPYHFDPEF